MTTDQMILRVVIVEASEYVSLPRARSSVDGRYIEYVDYASVAAAAALRRVFSRASAPWCQCVLLVKP